MFLNFFEALLNSKDLNQAIQNYGSGFWGPINYGSTGSRSTTLPRTLFYLNFKKAWKIIEHLMDLDYRGSQTINLNTYFLPFQYSFLLIYNFKKRKYIKLPPPCGLSCSGLPNCWNFFAQPVTGDDHFNKVHLICKRFIWVWYLRKQLNWGFFLQL